MAYPQWQLTIAIGLRAVVLHLSLTTLAQCDIFFLVVCMKLTGFNCLLLTDCLRKEYVSWLLPKTSSIEHLEEFPNNKIFRRNGA